VKVTLESALAAGREPLVPFDASWRRDPVRVRAVLERTAVIYPADTAGDPEDRVLVRLGEVDVDPTAVRWQPARRGWGAPKHVGPRRCTGCGRGQEEVRFPVTHSWLCAECRRQRQADYRRSMTGKAA
jgi:hypothetical protein